MPFKSEKQRRYLWANEPEIARDWTDTYGSKIKKAEGGITRIPFRGGKDASTRSFAVSQGGGGKKGQAHADRIGREYGFSGRDVAGDSGRQVSDAQAAIEKEKFEKAQKRKKTLEKNKSFLDKWRQKSINQFVKRNKYKNLIRAGVYEDFPGLYGKMIGYMNPPDEVGDFDIDSIREIAATTPGSLSKIQSQGLAGLRRDFEFEKKYADKDPTQREFDDYYGLNKPPETRGNGGGYMGYPSYEAYLAAQQQGGGGGTTVAEEVVETPSAFQQSLNTGVSSSPYYVGADPTAANIAWGQQFGVDPRTMYMAEGGPIRQRYFLGKLVKKIGRAAKKIIKSPVGKAALGIGAFMYGPKLLGAKSLGGFGGWGQMVPKIAKNKMLSGMLLNKDKDAFNPWKVGLGALSLSPFLMGGQEEDEGKEAFDYQGAKQAYLNEIMKIKRDAMAGTLDPSQFVYQGIKDGGRIGYAGGGSEDPMLVDEYKKYVFEMEEMGLQPMSFEEFKAQAISGMASGGRAGYYEGGQSIPSENSLEDARKTAMQDRLGGITEVMKQADLYRQGDVGQMYMAEGGEIGSRNRLSELMVKLANGTITLEEKIELMHLEKDSTSNKAQGGRIGADEGGIMDLGGVEKDYRETGGFVPIGKEEKADDVPARLSLNEFVMTADAVRGMGDGNIDQGAERMEDLMETLEVKGKKNQGAQDMFEVSERLSAVV